MTLAMGTGMVRLLLVKPMCETDKSKFSGWRYAPKWVLCVISLFI